MLCHFVLIVVVYGSKLLPLLVAVSGIWGALAALVKLKKKHFVDFTGEGWNGLNIVSIPLDDGSKTGLLTATSNYTCDHVIFYDSDTVSQKDVYRFHHEEFTIPFIDELRKSAALILGIEWEPGMPVPQSCELSCAMTERRRSSTYSWNITKQQTMLNLKRFW